MTEKEFHRQRRMFAIVNCVYVIAPAHDSRSHADWLYDVHQVTKPQLRGYVDETGLYFYSTADCQAIPGDWAQLRGYMPRLGQLLCLRPDTPVYEGVVVGQPGTRWPGRKCLGPLEPLL